MGGPKYRVTMVTAFPMVAIGIVCDLLQFLLTLTGVGALLSDLITFAAIPAFGIWFLILGVNYFSGRKAGVKMISAITSTIVELIPVLDALPTITLGLIFVIRASRDEDREKYEAEQRQMGHAAGPKKKGLVGKVAGAAAIAGATVATGGAADVGVVARGASAANKARSSARALQNIRSKIPVRPPVNDNPVRAANDNSSLVANQEAA